MKTILISFILSIQLFTAVSASAFITAKQEKKTMAYLQITLKISEKNRAAAAAVYQKYKAPFLQQIDGAHSKNLLIRKDDVQVMHGFESTEAAAAYLKSALFEKDVVRELRPYLESPPKVSIYAIM